MGGASDWDGRYQIFDMSQVMVAHGKGSVQMSDSNRELSP